MVWFLSGVHSAVVELYKHVLPGVAAHHTRKLLTRAATLLLLLPEGESVAEDRLLRERARHLQIDRRPRRRACVAMI